MKINLQTAERLCRFRLVACVIFMSGPAAAEDYDLVIQNGRVMDPQSGLDAVRNVGVKDGKIAKITKKHIKGQEFNRCDWARGGARLY